MKSNVVHLFAIIALCMLAELTETYATAHGGWKLESEKNGIKIYTRPVIGSKLKQVKAITSVKAPMATVVHVLTDYQNYKKWVNNVTESYVVDQPADSIHYVYTHEDAPWPVQNRYHVSRMTLTTNGSTSTLTFKSVPNYIQQSQKAIEFERYEGWWKVSATGSGSCRIELILDENPGGYVPPWLVNYMAVDAPLKTLENLKAVIEGLQKS